MKRRKIQHVSGQRGSGAADERWCRPPPEIGNLNE
jgi:hypothetical protein